MNNRENWDETGVCFRRILVCCLGVRWCTCIRVVQKKSTLTNWAWHSMFEMSRVQADFVSRWLLMQFMERQDIQCYEPSQWHAARHRGLLYDASSPEHFWKDSGLSRTWCPCNIINRDLGFKIIFSRLLFKCFYYNGILILLLRCNRYPYVLHCWCLLFVYGFVHAVPVGRIISFNSSTCKTIVILPFTFQSGFFSSIFPSTLQFCSDW